MPASIRTRLVLGAVLVTCALASMPNPGTAASSSVTLNMVVPTSTSIDPTGCASAGAAGSAGRTALGIVVPGDEQVSTLDCTVSFGSTNGTSRLLVHQQDGWGSAMARATDGTLDTDTGDGSSFNTVGYTSLSLGSGAEEAKSVAVQARGTSAGGLVTASYAVNASTFSKGYLLRYTAAGVRDMTFAGGTGVVWMNFSAGHDEWRDIGVDTQDRLLPVGVSNEDVAAGKLLIARYEADGDIDTTFSGGDATPGYDEISTAGSGPQEWQVVTVDSSGRIVVAGHTGTGNDDIVVARYLDDGRLDPTFSADGIQIYDPVGADELVEGIAIDTAGRIVIGGCAKVSTDTDTFAMRLTPTGALDTTFGTGGWTAVDVSAPDRADCGYGLALRPDGSMVLSGAGTSAGATETAIVVGLDADGDLDTTGFFAPTGYATLAIGSGAASFQEGLLAEPDGRVAIGGRALDPGSEMDMMAVRLNRDGSYDTSFSPGGTDGDGRLILDHASSTDAQNMAFGIDGSYVLAGEGAGGATGIARLQGSAVADWNTDSGAGPINDWTTTQGMFGICLRAVGGEVGKEATANAPAWGTASGTCSTAVSTPWRKVPATATDATSVVASAPAGTTAATASLRFGVRPDTAMRGSYAAPITFEVLSP